jgi:hypothetical protein
MATDTPTDVWVTGLTLEGATLKIQQRVLTGEGSPVASEMRRRLASVLSADSIGTGRWDTALPVSTSSPEPPVPARRRKSSSAADAA